MSKREPDIDPLSWESFESLMATPVGRRWVLKAGLASAVALAAKTWVAPAARAATVLGPGSGAVRKEVVPFQFALGQVADASELTLVAGGQRLPLIAHTAGSRRALAARGGLWGRADTGALSHFVEAVEMPADRAQLVSVVGRRQGRKVVVAQLWHCPRASVTAFARMAAELDPRGLERAVGSDERVARLGIRAADVRTPEEVGQLAGLVDPQSTAVAFVMLHPNISTIDEHAASITTSLLHGNADVKSLGNTIGSMQKRGLDPVEVVTEQNPDGSPTILTIGDQQVPLERNAYNTDYGPFAAALKAGTAAGVKDVRSDVRLGGDSSKPLTDFKGVPPTWLQPAGQRSVPQEYSPPATQSRAPRDTTGLQIKVKNEGFLIGTKTEVSGDYHDGKVPLRLYNNFVRWIAVYVQYIGRDGKNLSAGTGRSFPDTDYAQFLGLLPQVFTVLGVPVWDQNTIDVELDYPEEAQTARLLFCGLGSNLLDGGWRQYFPDDAYPGAIAPTSEVLFPAIITGLLTIALNVFALASALNIAATWAAIRSQIQDGFDVLNELVHPEKGNVFAAQLLPIILNNSALTAGEAATTAIVGGGSTYAQIEANHKGFDMNNLWKLLLSIGGILAKLLFSPGGFLMWSNIAYEVLAFSSAAAVADALPVIGQVVMATSIIGDAVTLAECCAETVISPWLIENEVSRSYKAQITIKPDHRDGGGVWPKTARKWTLSATVDGGVMPDVVTDSRFQKDGLAGTAPLVLDLTAPFGGRSISWSVVFEDASGNQVGTGVSPSYPNDDPKNIPDKVEFEITEVPVPITPDTVFKRTLTTAYSEADNGYTWSNQVAVDAVKESGGVQEVISTSIATRLGVAGIVWKAGDRYFVRGVPVAQDGKTISLGTVPGSEKGYTRRPFVLLDSFVEDADAGNHWLLEPDPTEQYYHIRKLTLDPKTGGMTFDGTESHGLFLLPVSAAAVHKSGRIIAINTNSSRVAWLEPFPGERPPVANYSGGVSKEGGQADFGLLATPTQVAITSINSVVLILEAGGPGLGAFDLNANPVKQFGSGDSKSASLALDKSKTYLDISVDGAENIYLLHHTTPAGGTLQPQNFGVDVLGPDGTPITTKSTGVNVPHLAVDYWRSIYAANYAPLTVLGKPDQPRRDPKLGVDEPSLSRFDPTTPNPKQNKAAKAKK